MAKVKCDTVKIREIGQKLIGEANELNILMHELYMKVFSIQKNIGYRIDTVKNQIRLILHQMLSGHCKTTEKFVVFFENRPHFL